MKPPITPYIAGLTMTHATRRKSRLLHVPLILLAAKLAVATPLPEKLPQVQYQLAFTTASERPEWRFTVSARGLDPKSPAGMFLPDWGEWTKIDSYYLSIKESRPPLRRDPELPDRFVFKLPAGWDGSLHVVYDIRTLEEGSNAQENFKLLPVRSSAFSLGYSANTLMRVLSGGRETSGGRTLDIVAPDGWTIVTGWGGISKSRQQIELEPGAGNTTIAFGVPVSVAVSTDEFGTYEAVQFSPGPEVASSVLNIVSALGRSYSESTGSPAGALRVVMSPMSAGGTGTFTEGCLSVNAMPGLADNPLDPGYVHFLGHELFHAWLPGRLKPQEESSTVWFHEGFTEYLSLRHAAKAGLISRGWFAYRLLAFENELKDNPALGKVAFGDPAVRWREGPNEQIAYKGGALLAFAMDAELRRQGRPGLMELIRDRLLSRTYSLDSLFSWMRAHGLKEFAARYFDGKEPPDLPAAFGAAGFRKVEGGYSIDKEACDCFFGEQ